MEKKERIEQLRYELNIERQRGAMADAGKIEDVERQIAELEQENVEESQQEVAYLMDNMDLDGMSMRDMFKNEKPEEAEAAYQFLRIAVQNTMLQRDEEWMARIKTLEERLAMETAAKDVAVAKADEMGEKNSELVIQIRDAKGLLEDAESKRDAAAGQLEEAKAEIERLTSHVDDLRKQIAVGAVNMAKVIDPADALAHYKEQKRIAEEEKRLAEAAREAAKPAIYDVEWGDAKKSFYTAKLAATDEEIKIPYLTKGAYREVSAEEAPQFRINTQESEHRDEDHAQPAANVEEGDQLAPPTWGYPEGDEATQESTGHELAEGDVAGSADPETEGPPTRAEFEELKRRVSALELPQSEVA
ncbi:hypothetical protein [Paenibacillus amylolyticus]|uniref:hypothetical protein n=1 Tax=Paenibacillus amylolyticus TaxID=1451 RepID=UPI00096E309D|nr:hypothetical protein [Paenibacillus amylolyticus]OMF47722.1 hypothetical protein BK136_02185 [Paenibacillus amylolyticus]